MSTPLFHECGELEELYSKAVAMVVECGREAIRSRGRFHLVLAGGSTPRPLYEELAQRGGDLDWAHVHFWWGDERCVPRDHADSNFKMAWETWLSKLAPKANRVHRIRGERGAKRAADHYEARVRSKFGDSNPRFDLALLGLGTDGHTASLFPNASDAEDRCVVPVFDAPKPPAKRVSLSEAALSSARRVLFLVVGAEKGEAVAGIRSAADSPAGRIAWAAPSEILYFFEQPR